MDVENVRYEGSSKFMWDGEIYEDRAGMKSKMEEYQGNNFEVRVFEQDGHYLLYTRRVVKEIVLDGPPPV